MKKALSILLLFLYSLSVSGAVMQMHFCGQQLRSLSLSATQASCCCKAPATNKKQSEQSSVVKKMKKGCCNSVAVSFNINADQHVEAVAPLQLLQTALIPEPIIVYTPELPGTLMQGAGRTFNAHAPPGLWQNIPLYQLFQRIVYYG